MHSEKRVEVCWMEDSSGRRTCHFNSGGSMAQTYIGELVLKEDETGGKWHARLKGEEALAGPFKTIVHAQRFVEESVNGEQVSD